MNVLRAGVVNVAVPLWPGFTWTASEVSKLAVVVAGVDGVGGGAGVVGVVLGALAPVGLGLDGEGDGEGDGDVAEVGFGEGVVVPDGDGVLDAEPEPGLLGVGAP